MTDQTKPLAVGLGEVLWDLFPAGKQLGGAPANFAYHAQVLGAQSSIVSCVGRDNTGLGQELLQQLRGHKLDTSHICIDAKHPTGTVSVQVDPAGVPTYIIHHPVAWDFIRASPELYDLAARANVACFGSLAQRSETSRNTIRNFLNAMDRKTLRIFDINLRQKFYDEQVIRDSLEAANVLKLNDQELPIVVDLLGLPGDERHAIGALIEDFDLKLIALTRGGAGSSVWSSDQRASDHPGYPVPKLADTVGAGDAFTAAFAIGLLHNRPLDAINDSANRLASYVCSQPGAMPPVPSQLVDQILRRV